MKLIERELGLEIELKENRVSILVIENVSQRMTLVSKLFEQFSGQESSWLLVEDEKSFDISKKCEIILEPFSIDLNSRKIISKLFQEIEERADEEFYEEGLMLHSQISAYLEQLLEKLPYPTEYSSAWDLSNVLKMYGVRLSEDCEDQFDKLCSYIKLLSQICGTEIFILVNMKPFFTEKQISELYKMASYGKIHLVLIEFNAGSHRYSEEDTYILDSDGCIITY